MRITTTLSIGVFFASSSLSFASDQSSSADIIASLLKNGPEIATEVKPVEKVKPTVDKSEQYNKERKEILAQLAALDQKEKFYAQAMSNATKAQLELKKSNQAMQERLAELESAKKKWEAQNRAATAQKQKAQKPNIRYTLVGIIGDDVAWIKSNQGSTVRVTVGDKLASYGQLLEINNGKLITANGIIE